jgi:hypothetical protein
MLLALASALALAMQVLERQMAKVAKAAKVAAVRAPPFFLPATAVAV